MRGLILLLGLTIFGCSRLVHDYKCERDLIQIYSRGEIDRDKYKLIFTSLNQQKTYCECRDTTIDMQNYHIYKFFFVHKREKKYLDDVIFVKY